MWPGPQRGLPRAAQGLCAGPDGCGKRLKGGVLRGRRLHRPGKLEGGHVGGRDGVGTNGLGRDGAGRGAAEGLGKLTIRCGEDSAVVAENPQVGDLHLDLQLRLGERGRTGVAQGGEQQGETDELAGP